MSLLIRNDKLFCGVGVCYLLNQLKEIRDVPKEIQILCPEGRKSTLYNSEPST